MPRPKVVEPFKMNSRGELVPNLPRRKRVPKARNLSDSDSDSEEEARARARARKAKFRKVPRNEHRPEAQV